MSVVGATISGQMTIGFAGLGVMGEPMCRNLIRKAVSGESDALAIRAIVFDVQTAALDRMCELGAVQAASIADLTAQSDILFLSLPGGNEVAQVINGSGGVFEMASQLPPKSASKSPGAGLLIVDMSTSPVQLTKDLAGKARKLGLSYVDSPVARTREAAQNGTLAMMVGASDEDFALVQPYLACMASDIQHCGDVGAGQTVKILNNMVLFQTVQGLAEALTLGRRAGLSGEVLFDALEKGSADSFALRNHGRKALLSGDFPLRAFSTQYASKDLDYALQLAQDTNTDTPAAQTIRQVFEKTINAGHVDEYWPAILKVIEDDK